MSKKMPRIFQVGHIILYTRGKKDGSFEKSTK